MTDLKMLDCFCGLGGASSGFAKEGFDCTGIDIINVGYPYRFILADMHDLKGEDYRGYDVIWGSPPCRDFSNFCRVYGKRWKNPPNPEKGLILVNRFLKFAENAKPKIWIMENVYHLAKHLPLNPQMTTFITSGKKHCFWGNFPAFLMPRQKKVLTEHDMTVPHDRRWPVVHDNKLSAWERARIPLACSQAFARACKEALLEKELTL